MRIQRLMACTLSFCLAFSGAIPAGAVSQGTGEMGQEAAQSASESGWTVEGERAGILTEEDAGSSTVSEGTVQEGAESLPTEELSGISDPSETIGLSRASGISELSEAAEPSGTAEASEATEPSGTAGLSEAAESSGTAEASEATEPSGTAGLSEAAEPSGTIEPSEAPDPSMEPMAEDSGEDGSEAVSDNQAEVLGIQARVSNNQAVVSDNQPVVSGNELRSGGDSDSGNVVDSPEWVVDESAKQYKLKKPVSGNGFFTASDGLVKVKATNGKYVYYSFDANGLMQAGRQEISAGEGSPGIYYFLTEAESTQSGQGAVPTPENSDIGQMQADYWELADAGNSVWYYYGENGLRTAPADMAGEHEIRGNVYLLDASGQAQAGVQAVGGVTYVYDSSSTPKGQKITKTGWLEVSQGRWFYLKSGGARDNSKTGKQKLPDGKTYYLSTNGTIQKDVLKTISGSHYYFGADGAMVTGCFQDVSNGSTRRYYYFLASGKRLEKTGWQKINGELYYFHEDHYWVIKTKWQKITLGGTTGWYYFSDSGELYTDQIVHVGGYRYYVNGSGKMVTGLRSVKGSRYYFRKEAEGDKPIGSAYVGWKKISGRWYHFKANGKAETGEIVKIGKKYYSFTSNGKMVKGGWWEINGKLYYFQKQTSKERNGYAVTKKWLKRNGKWYYATAKGYMKTDSWMKYKGNYYYFNSKGVMVTNKWKQHDGKWGYLDGNGIFSTKWIKKNGKWKYAKKNGKFATGWTYIVQNGTKYKYYFTEKGYLVQDVRGQVSGPYKLKVDRVRNQITVYAKDTDGKYNIPVVAMPCSVGLSSTPTPTGTYTGTRAGRWQLLMGPSWGQYATYVTDGIYIHSVSGPAANSYSLPANEWNKLGREAASHGCIRVAVIDAKWIYENCNGAIIEINDYANAGPFDHKTYTQITAEYNWDPTDPEAKGYL